MKSVNFGHIHMIFEGKAKWLYRENKNENSTRVKQILHQVNSLICIPLKDNAITHLWLM